MVRRWTLSGLKPNEGGACFGTIVSANCNSHARRPAAFCRRLLCVSRTPWACCSTLTIDFLEKARRCREPASSSTRAQIPARPGTGGTESTPATGKVAAELCGVTRTSMPAELLGPAASNHSFLTRWHCARGLCGVLLEEGRLKAAKRAALLCCHLREQS